MKVAVFGLGYVGITSACCISSQGHEVIGYDINRAKVENINAAVTPIREPDIPELLERAVSAGTLWARTEIGAEFHDCDLAIVCVGTPSNVDGAHNMGFIADVTQQIATATKGRQKPLSVIYRSTVRPGTMEELIAPIFEADPSARKAELDLVYNPEFLREGSAVADYFAPPKIVIGTKEKRISPAVAELNQGINAKTFNVGFREAEMTKFVDNSWHAAKVSFANEIGRICLALGISARQVHEIFTSDTKLNISPYYLRPGGAFGGSCLPKDVRALQHIAADVGVSVQMIDSILRSNETHKHRLFALATEGLRPPARVLMAGLAFKAGTDDLRESPNVDLARKLLAAGYDLDIFDPAIDAAKLIGVNLGYAYSQLPALNKLLVDQWHAEQTSYDRIIATNATIDQLAPQNPDRTIHLGTLP